VRRSIDDHGLGTRLVSIDPHPRAETEALCNEVVRQPLEDTDLSIFAALGPDDICFIDNSHLAFQNSVVTVFMLEVLPSLRPGVLVGIHDIMLPGDYPEAWRERFYNGQYLLAAFLLGRARRHADRAAGLRRGQPPRDGVDRQRHLGRPGVRRGRAPPRRVLDGDRPRRSRAAQRGASGGAPSAASTDAVIRSTSAVSCRRSAALSAPVTASSRSRAGPRRLR
jgi:hypothetical protein